MVCSVWIRQWPAEDGLISEVPMAFCIVFTNFRSYYGTLLHIDTIIFYFIRSNG